MCLQHLLSLRWLTTLFWAAAAACRAASRTYTINFCVCFFLWRVRWFCFGPINVKCAARNCRRVTYFIVILQTTSGDKNGSDKNIFNFGDYTLISVWDKWTHRRNEIGHERKIYTLKWSGKFFFSLSFRRQSIAFWDPILLIVLFLCFSRIQCEQWIFFLQSIVVAIICRSELKSWRYAVHVPHKHDREHKWIPLITVAMKELHIFFR